MITLFFSRLKCFVRKNGVFLFLLLCFGCTSSTCHEGRTPKQTDVKKFVSTLPKEERFLLEFFFRSLIQKDAIGYTLLGGKPMSVYSYLKPKVITNSYRHDPIDRMELFFDGFDERDALFHRGLEIWKKYENDFCGTNIFFDVFENDSDLHFMQVSVFNKRLMLPLFERYFHKFKDLDPSIRDNEALFDLLVHDQQFKEKFYVREDLLGICLGYGEKNAELFQKMATLLTSMGRLDFTLERPSADRLKSLEQEFTTLKRTFTGGIHTPVSRKFFFNIGLGFRADFSDPETLFLQKKYAELHKKLTQAYEETAFLEKTLELICIADKTEF
jgi:hypothetical protein